MTPSNQGPDQPSEAAAGPGPVAAGIGAGPLSEAARARLARASEAGTEVLRPPPRDDHAAVAAWRETVHRAWLAGDPDAEACGHHPVTLGGVRCLRAGPAAAVQGPLVVYCHGGGYALGSPEVALPITEQLARRVAVVSVDYRLAPEHPWPAGADDLRRVWWALRAAEPHRPLALAGDSAGANLALGLAAELGSAAPASAAGGPAPAGPVALVLLSPHLDHAAPRTGGPPQPMEDLDADGAAWLRAAYCGDHPPGDPGISPLRGPLGGLPPTLVQVGTRDGALAHGVRLARLARRAGAPVTLDVWDGLWHAWHYHRDLPEADAALDEAAGHILAAAG